MGYFVKCTAAAAHLNYTMHSGNPTSHFDLCFNGYETSLQQQKATFRTCTLPLPGQRSGVQSGLWSYHMHMSALPTFSPYLDTGVRPWKAARCPGGLLVTWAGKGGPRGMVQVGWLPVAGGVQQARRLLEDETLAQQGSSTREVATAVCSLTTSC